MVRVPHDVFRHILSFKDPRYENVRSGASKPCWRPWDRRFEEPRDYTILGHYAELLHQNPQFRVYEHGVSSAEEKHFHIVGAVERLEDHLDGLYWAGETVPENLPLTLDELSLQCEACGPDLELYDMLR